MHWSSSALANTHVRWCCRHEMHAELERWFTSRMDGGKRQQLRPGASQWLHKNLDRPTLAMVSLLGMVHWRSNSEHRRHLMSMEGEEVSGDDMVKTIWESVDDGRKQSRYSSNSNSICWRLHVNSMIHWLPSVTKARNHSWRCRYHSLKLKIKN